MRLEARDRTLLREAFLSKVIGRNHLIALGHFSSVGRCNARLLALKRGGYLAVRDQISGVDLRAPLYACTRRSVRLVAEDLGLGIEEALALYIARQSDLSLRHALRCTELRLIAERDLSSGSHPRLLTWAPEVLCHHEFIGPSGTRVTVKPDALAVLEWRGTNPHLFLEIDLGHVSLPNFREKIARYRAYAQSGAFADAYGVAHFLVLTVTTDERRLASLVETADTPNYLFTTWKRLANHALSDEVLTVLGGVQTSLGAAINAIVGAG